jgi:hypothetical protein
MNAFKLAASDLFTTVGLAAVAPALGRLPTGGDEPRSRAAD